MRRTIIAALALTACLALPSGANAASCRFAGHRVVERGSDGVVLEGPLRDGFRTSYGCLFSVGRRVRLDHPDEGINAVSFALAGRYVAFHQRFFEPVGDHFDDMVVVDLRTDRRRHIAELYTDERYDEGVLDAGTTDMALRRNGSVAWISCEADSEGCDRSTPYQVHRIDGRGHRLLDTGRRIGPRSLRLTRRTVRWTNAGEPRSASLR
jgi:hypothetical protein